MYRLPHFLICALLTAVSLTAGARPDSPDGAVPASDADSTIAVIGWFAVNETADYTVEQSRWQINGSDTALIACVNSRVRLAVVDSTSSGYVMDYTVVDVAVDTLDASPIAAVQSRIDRRIARSLVGTTIRFTTGECGDITGYVDMPGIERRAESIFREAMDELMATPEMKAAVEMGFEPQKIEKMIDPEAIVDSYLSTLKLIFMYHGNAYIVGDTCIHQAATATSYENDVCTEGYVDVDDGCYSISTEVVNVIPRSEIKTLIGGMVGGLIDTEKLPSLTENLDNVFDSQITTGGTLSEWVSADFLPYGWPETIVFQNTMSIGDCCRINQTRITLDRLAPGTPSE